MVARVYWFSSSDAPNYYSWDLLGVDKCGGADRTYVRREDGITFLPRGLVARGSQLYWASSEVIRRVAK